MKKAISLFLAVLLIFAMCVSASADDAVKFKGTDAAGNACDESILKDSKVTLINRWEPWCPPCRGELPYLGELYSMYKDQGFSVLGMYGYTEVDEYTLNKTAAEILEEAGCTYPTVLVDETFYVVECAYVPHSVFVNSAGEILPLDQEIVNSLYDYFCNEEKEFIDGFAADYDNGVYDRYKNDPDAVEDLNYYYELSTGSEEAKEAYLQEYNESNISSYGKYFDNNVIPCAIPKEIYEEFILSFLEAENA